MNKTIVALALTVVASLGAQARETGRPVGRRVTVCIDANIDPLLLAQAKALASDMFAGIGVKIEWRGDQQDAIRISFRTRTAEALLPGALARAWPYQGVRIEVFYDRVQRSIEPRAVAALLAHVLVHEVSHALQGMARHSESGVMKAKWDNNDYANMKWKSLPFTKEDVLLIQWGLASR